MTLKNAVAELPFGGAKAVILKADDPGDRETLMRRFGEFVARMGGAYIPGVDMGTTTADLAVIGEAGAEVSCATEDPAPWTALGVSTAIKAAVAHVYERSSLDGIRVLVQGAGHVGAELARNLAADGATIVVADTNGARAEEVAAELNATVVPAASVLETPCDVLAPCAIARVLSARTIDHLRCRIVAGGANDTLAEPSGACALKERGITYVPDFVANAGGVIHIHALRQSSSEDVLRADVLRIGDRVSELLCEASASDATPFAVAEARAARILARAGAERVARD
jgi:leucine dehydrogenase